MYERRHEALLPRRKFVARVAKSALWAAELIALSLLIGTVGYHTLGRLEWVDAVLNASMILGGMGPVDRIESTAGKLFASAYALYSGFALLGSVGVLMAPVFHRFLHRFHLEQDGRRAT